VGTGTIQLLYSTIGAGWTLVLLTGLSVIFLPIPFFVMHYAPAWRMRRREKKEEKLRRKGSEKSSRR
jgi:hypothetical protein